MVAKNKAQRRLWHYTVGTKLLPILTTGRIKRASARLMRPERAAVWFSIHQSWEPTATKILRNANGAEHKMTIEEMVMYTGVLVRLQVPPTVAPYDWAHHRRHGRVDTRIADGLEVVARKDGADPSEWRLSYKDVSLHSVTSIEASRDGVTWMSVGSRGDDGILVVSDAFLTALENRFSRMPTGTHPEEAP